MRSGGWQLKYAHSLSMIDKDTYSFLPNLASVVESPVYRYNDTGEFDVVLLLSASLSL